MILSSMTRGKDEQKEHQYKKKYKGIQYSEISFNIHTSQIFMVYIFKKYIFFVFVYISVMKCQ